MPRKRGAIRDEQLTDGPSAGLTLTAARMVHLLEPVLSHGFELQGEGLPLWCVADRQQSAV